MGTGKTYSTKYLLDSNNSSGVAGQVLSTTSTGIDWVDANTVPGTGLWLASGNNIYNSNSGNVGIGTTSPDSLLELENSPAAQTKSRLLHIDNNPIDNQGSGYIEISSGSNNKAKTQIEQVSSGGFGLLGNQYMDTNIINRGLSSSAYGNINFATGSSSSSTSIVMTIGGGSQKGNVGIGTTSPISSLNITTTKTVALDTAAKFLTLGLTVDDLTAGDTAGGGGGIAFRSKNTNAGAQVVFGAIDAIKESANVSDFKGSLRFFTNQNSTGIPLERMRIDSDGNVGIGTDSPDVKLHIVGDGDRLEISSADYDLIKMGAYGDSGADLDNGFLNLSLDGSEKIRLLANGTSYFNGGNVGIGTTSPAAKLEVDSSTAPQILVKNTSGGDAKILFEDSSGVTQNASITFNESGQNTFTIATGYQSSSNANRINIAPAGHVALTAVGGSGGTSATKIGIGTTSPGAKLDVTGNYGDVIKAVSGSQNITTNFVAPSTGSGLNNIISTGGKFNIGTSDAQPFILVTGSIARVYILSGGNVGINTTFPSYKLEVNGTLGVKRDDGIIFAGSLGPGMGNKITADTSNDFIFSTSLPSAPYTVSEKMRIANNGATTFTSTVTATNFILSSDERLKENVEKVCDNRVKADWKTFELKTEKGYKRYGVIAQELEKTNPEFVREDSQGFKSVAYIDLLIAKIAELEARLEKLEK